MSNSKAFIPREKNKYIGTYRPKYDAKEKVLGKTPFFDDITLRSKFPGMLFCKILNSPYANATILSMDTSQAESLPGVRVVLRYDDPEILSLKVTTHGWTDTAITNYARDTIDRFWDRRFLSNTARWVGDQMGVAVAADTPDIAEAALGMINIKWDTRPFVLEMEESKKSDAPILHPELNPTTNQLRHGSPVTDDLTMDQGDVEKAFSESDFIINVDKSYGGQSTHGTLDYRGCVIDWNEDKMNVWTNHYYADMTRMYLHEHLNVPLNKIRVRNGNSGASMGKWNTGEDVFYVITAILSRRTRRPVKYKMTNHEEFHDGRSENRFVIKAGCKDDGMILGMDIIAEGNSGAYIGGCDHNTEFIVMESAERFFAPVKNVRLHSYTYFTSKMPGGVVRAIGNIQFNYALMQVYDEVAEKTGIDILEILKKNCGNIWNENPNKSLAAVLDTGAEKIGWDKRQASAAGSVFENGKRRGIGVSAWNQWHAEWQENDRGYIEVSIRLNPDMSVIIQAPTSETGAGGNSVAVFGCAEALDFLNITPEDIQWPSLGDTEMGLRDSPPTDSVVSFLYAEAMIEAAVKLKNEICRRIGIYWNVNPDDLEVENASVFEKSNPEHRIGVGEFMMGTDCVPIHIHHARNNNKNGKGMPYGAWFAEVEVDEELGSVEVLNLVLVNDAGHVMHASGIESQQLGGQCLGLGEALIEELIYDTNTGTMLNNNYIDYKMPTLADFPSISTGLVEEWRGGGKYGAAGVAEGTLTGTAAAINNAIYNAIGVRINGVPIKQQSILSAIKRKNNQTKEGEENA
jgi:xanthine dehydrogenase molybdenum-binding subunit